MQNMATGADAGGGLADGTSQLAVAVPLMMLADARVFRHAGNGGIGYKTAM